MDCSWIRHLHAGDLPCPAQPYQTNIIGWNSNRNIGLTETFASVTFPAAPQELVQTLLRECQLVELLANLGNDKALEQLQLAHLSRTITRLVAPRLRR